MSTFYDTDSTVSLSVTLCVIGASVGVVVLGIVVYALCRNRDELEELELGDHTPIIHREDLVESLLENGEEEWQCIVCAHLNHPKKENCLICGTGQNVLKASMPYKFSKTLSSSYLLSSDDDAMLESSARQRALQLRRINSISKQIALTQRQRGAKRRKLWGRVKDVATGKFKWVREPLNDSATTVLPTTKLELGPHGGTLADLHTQSAISKGFVVQYGELGNLDWKRADDVTMDMKSFKNLSSLIADVREPVDFEGVVAMHFREKKHWFVTCLSKLATPITEGVVKIVIRREHLLEDSINQLLRISPEHIHYRLKVEFQGEPGLDAGGLLREWYTLVCHAIFDQSFGLFIATHGENLSYWINPLSSKAFKDSNVSDLEYYRFVGLLLGRGIFEGLVLDVHIALPLLKHFLGVPISFSDLEFLDDALHRNCVWMKSNTHVEALCVTFSINQEDGTEVDLIPNGRNIDVTDSNKAEYLALVLEYRMLKSIADQLESLLSGFYEVIPKSMIAPFDYQELELFLCG